MSPRIFGVWAASHPLKVVLPCISKVCMVSPPVFIVWVTSPCFFKVLVASPYICEIFLVTKIYHALLSHSIKGLILWHLILLWSPSSRASKVDIVAKMSTIMASLWVLVWLRHWCQYDFIVSASMASLQSGTSTISLQIWMSGLDRSSTILLPKEAIGIKVILALSRT